MSEPNEELDVTNLNEGSEQGVSDEALERATGRYKYFRPEPNQLYTLLANKWGGYEQETKNGKQFGLRFEVIKVDNLEFTDEPKIWSTTSVRIAREMEPLIKAVQKKGLKMLHFTFEKILSRGEKDTDAKFRVKNLDPAIDAELEPDQRSKGGKK